MRSMMEGAARRAQHLTGEGTADDHPPPSALRAATSPSRGGPHFRKALSSLRNLSGASTWMKCALSGTRTSFTPGSPA